MSARATAVYGIYASREQVEEGIAQLVSAGFVRGDISVLFAENVGTKDFGHEKHTKAPEGGAAGAGSGALLGGALGWLAGIGALAIPGIGPLVAAGPIMAMLGGAGVGGALLGVTGALIGSGIPEYEAKRYEGRVRRGGILLAVHCQNPERAGRAKALLNATGAEDVASSREGRGAREQPGRARITTLWRDSQS